MSLGILWYPVAAVGQVWEGTTERWTVSCGQRGPSLREEQQRDEQLFLRIHIWESLSNGVWKPRATERLRLRCMHFGVLVRFSPTHRFQMMRALKVIRTFQDTAYDIAIQQFGKKELRAQICIRYLWSFGKKSGSKAKSSPDHHPTFVAQDSCFLQARPPCALFLQRGTTQPTG